MRRQNSTGYSGSAFVYAIVFTIAEIALNVAPGRDRKVDPTVKMPHFIVETGMIFQVHDTYILNLAASWLQICLRVSARRYI
jgi:hypothetical protein